MNLTYVDNVVDAMLAAMNSDVRTGSIYNVADSDIDQGEVADVLRRVTHGYIQPVFVPYVFVWSMMLGVDLLSLFRKGKLGTARYRLDSHVGQHAVHMHRSAGATAMEAESLFRGRTRPQRRVASGYPA